jgi:hypothetical protein
MPKIPLYNQGAGPSLQMAAGTLGPRAQSGAFEAPGRALAGFADAAGQVAFNFGMAERKREDRTIVAEEELAAKDYFGTKLLEDQSISKEEAESNFKQHRDTFLQGIESKGYSERRKQLVLSAVNNVYAQRGLDAKINAFNRGTRKATETDEMLLDSNLEILRTYPVDSPQYQKAASDNANIFSVASGENRKLKYTPEAYDLRVKIDRANLAFANAETPAQADAAYEALRQDASIPPSKLLEAKNLRNSVKKRLGDELFDSTLEMITETDLSSSEALQISNGFDAGEDFTVTRENGEEISFSVKNMPISKRRQMSKIVSSIGDEYKNQIRAGIVSDVDDAFEAEGLDGALAIATVAVNDAEDKEEADAAILGSARNFDAKAQIAYAEGDFEGALAFSEVAENLINTSFMSRPSLSENAGTVGVASNTILKSVAKTRVDIQEKRQEEAFISYGVKLAQDGLLDNHAGTYTKPQETEIMNRAMFGKSLPEQIALVSSNNVVFEPFKGTMIGAAKEALSATPDLTVVSEGLELYRQVKTRARGAIDRHTDDETRAFFDSVLSLEDVGVDTQDAINRVSRAFQTGVDVNAKYSTVKAGVDSILDNQITSVFGITLSGERVDNRVMVHQRLEDLSKVYIRMGTMSAEEAVAAAVEAINDSHINLRGQLIPRRKNFPFYPNDENLRRMVDLAAEDFMTKYSADSAVLDEDDNVALIPAPNRVDQWQITINGVPATTGIDSIYSISDLQGLMAADRKTVVDEIIQDNLQKRGLTEEQQLSKQAQDLNKQANALTGAAISKIRQEQGEAAAQAAIGERQRLLDEAEDIRRLLQESKRLKRGD